MSASDDWPGVSLKPIEVPKALQDGEKFIKWDEDSGTGLPVTLRVDAKGFFLYWTDQNMEVELLEMAYVRDVRTGVYAKVPKEAKMRNLVTIGSQGSLEDKTVSVCHGGDFTNVSFINFCCAKKEIAQMWTDALFSLAYNMQQVHGSALAGLEKLHARLVLRADKSARVLVKNVVRTFAANKEDKRRVEKALSEAGLPSGKGDSIPLAQFTFDDFFTFYKQLTQRTEVTEIFNQLTGGKPVLPAAALAQFLNSEQRDPRLNEILHPYADAARAQELLARHEPNPHRQAKEQLTEHGFLRLLLSGDSGPVAAAALELCDLTQPLAHYFVNSSHNTYLTGHQITGRSSVEIYRQALLAGCRCVELDFWNGRTEEPVIVHGYTFVPEIGARDVLEAIAESAFKTSDCPVVLSFENHCNPRQQAKIAAYCRDIFGDMLLSAPLPTHPLQPGGELPSPAQLRRKIIIKNKKKHHHRREPPIAPPLPESDEEVASRLPRQPSSETSESESSSGEEEGAGAGAGATPAGPVAEGRETHAGAEISALVNYVQPVHFTSFENAEKKSRFYEMSSFDEKQATTLLKERPVEFVNYNKQQLSRVYPAGTRFDSSNFMPQVFWNAGCQLVALNYQTLDLAMQLNLGAFEYSRRCGYLLKPEFMRRKDRRLDPFAESTVDGIIAGSLSVRVLSGQLLSERRANTYVEVDLFGLPADTVRKRFRTRTVPNNGINPVYGDEPFVFKKVVLPPLALVRLAAVEEGGRLLGQRVLPLGTLRPGYRHVPLRSERGLPLPLPAALLLHVRVSDYVPDQLSELAEALANPIKYQSELDRREHQLAVLTDDTGPEQEVVATNGTTTNGEEARAPPPAPSPRATPAPAPVEPSLLPLPTEPAEPPVLTGEPAAGESLEALLQCRAARVKRAELARKLDALRRKPPNKFYVPGRLAKRLSARALTVDPPATPSAEAEAGAGASAAADALAAERALRLRYHHAIHAALEKHLRTTHHHQMKALQELLDADKKEVLARLAAARKEDVKALAKRAPRDKDELTRMKREIHAQSVERGVAECSRLEDLYARRRETLAREQERARDLLQRHRDQELQELEQLCGGGGGG